MKNLKLLQNLGLTDIQASIYLSTLELGQASIQDIADRSGVQRTNIYNYISELKNIGLISEAKKSKKRVFSATDPEVLLEIEEARIARLKKALPELKKMRRSLTAKPNVTFYEGMDNMLAVYRDQLKEKKPIFAFEDLEHMKKAMPKWFYESWAEDRARKNIAFSSILRDSDVAKEFTKFNAKLLRKSKLVQSADWKTEINIYGNKVALMSFRSKKPFCVLIEDENIAHTLKDVWDMIWQLSPDKEIS